MFLVMWWWRGRRLSQSSDQMAARITKAEHIICGRVLIRGQSGPSPRVRLETSIDNVELDQANEFLTKKFTEHHLDFESAMHPGESFEVVVGDNHLKMIRVWCPSCAELLVLVEPGNLSLDLVMDWKRPTEAVRYRDEVDE